MVTGPIGKHNLNTSLKSFERSFYFEKPSEDYVVIGLDEVYKISENGETRFVATEKKMNELKSNVISNWDSSKPLNIPLFVGAMKFQPERSEDIWTEFDDSTWFIPEVMLFRTNQKNFLVFNVSFSSTTHIEKIKERIKKKLESLFDQTEKEVLQAKIKSISGNSPKEKKKWKGFVTHALENILENNIDKVVLSRRIELLLNNEPNLDYLAESLRTSYPRCSIFCYHHGKSNFFGASPERLALFSAGKMMIEVLAGSAPRGKDEIEDLSIEKDVLMSEKIFENIILLLNTLKMF
ncbi:MAG: chorismate-binding protein [Ignavibacteriales bacterium]|nr:chorismate-binding protein [Ignavibacteriales bacterium]